MCFSAGQVGNEILALLDELLRLRYQVKTCPCPDASERALKKQKIDEWMVRLSSCFTENEIKELKKEVQRKKPDLLKTA